MKKICLLLTILFFSQFHLIAQTDYVLTNSRLVEVKSKELVIELDSVLELEKKCNYFNDPTLFHINIVQRSGYKEISIGAIDNYAFDSIGFSFIYKNHIFQIFSDSPNIDSCLYTLTNYWMHYVVNYTNYLKNRFANDDTMSVFDYEYRNGIFIRKGTYLCE